MPDENTPIQEFYNQEDLERIILSNEEISQEIIKINEFLVLKEEKNDLKDETINQSLKEEKVLLDERNLLEEEVLKERYDNLVLAIQNSTPQSVEIISYKDELINLNSNLLEGFSGFTVFIGLAIGVVLSLLLLRGVFE